MNLRDFDKQIGTLPAKLKLLGFVYQLLRKKQANIHSRFNNVIQLNAVASNYFLLGDTHNGSFIAMQDDFLPWLCEMNITEAVVCYKTGYIYLVSRDEDFGYISYAIGIKCRMKRLLALADVIDNKELQIKVCRVAENNEVFISAKSVHHGIVIIQSDIESFIDNDPIEQSEELKSTLLDYITSQ